MEENKIVSNDFNALDIRLTDSQLERLAYQTVMNFLKTVEIKED